MSLLDLLGVIAVVSALLLVTRLLSSPHIGIPHVFTVHDLGRLESSFQDLISVIVIANTVDDPKDELRHAVEQNFSRGVKYRFLISKSNAERELNGYYRIFEVLSEIAQRHKAPHELDHLVSIEALPYEWLEYPFVFYELRDADHGRTWFVAVRGTKRLKGIAPYYVKVEPEYAHMIARAVMSDAPSSLIVSRPQFKETKVLPFASAQAGS